MKEFKISENANPNYLACICKIGEIHPIEGADRICKTIVNGFDIVIGNNMKEGDVVVYVPVEAAICSEFLSANNLYEIGEWTSNANHEEVGILMAKVEELKSEGKFDEADEYYKQAKALVGYFNKRNRVRIVTLKGISSNGFVAGIDSLVRFDSELADTDWESLINTRFNYIGEKEFCWKYIPPIKEQYNKGTQKGFNKKMKKLKRFDRLIENQFAFHYDTERLDASNIANKLEPDDIVTITTKVHGCVDKNTIIETKEFGELTIGYIVENKLKCSVKAYNTKTNEIIYTPIYDWYFLKNDGEWYEIELEDGRTIKITGNNPVWLPELNCYRKVSELNGDEKLLIDK